MKKRELNINLMKEAHDYLVNEDNLFSWLLTRSFDELKNIQEDEDNSPFIEYCWIFLRAYCLEKKEDSHSEEIVDSILKTIKMKCAMASLQKAGYIKHEDTSRYYELHKEYLTRILK